MVVATKPGTSVPVKVLRNKQEQTLTVTVDELDLDAEQNADASLAATTISSRPRNTAAGSFGLTLENLTPQLSRRLQLPSGQSGAVDHRRRSRRAVGAALLRQGDVILSVNRKPVSSAADAARELQKVASGRIAQLLRLARRRRGVRAGRRRTDAIADCRLPIAD